jgi:hypothetical protein
VLGPHVMEAEVLQNLEPKADVAAQQCVSCLMYLSSVSCCLILAWPEKEVLLCNVFSISKPFIIYTWKLMKDGLISVLRQNVNLDVNGQLGLMSGFNNLMKLFEQHCCVGYQASFSSWSCYIVVISQRLLWHVKGLAWLNRWGSWIGHWIY